NYFKNLLFQMNLLGPENSIKSAASSVRAGRRPSSLHPLLGAIKKEQSVEAPQIEAPARRSTLPAETLITPDISEETKLKKPINERSKSVVAAKNFLSNQ